MAVDVYALLTAQGLQANETLVTATSQFLQDNGVDVTVGDVTVEGDTEVNVDDSVTGDIEAE